MTYIKKIKLSPTETLEPRYFTDEKGNKVVMYDNGKVRELMTEDQAVKRWGNVAISRMYHI